MSRRLCGEWAGGYVVVGGPWDFTVSTGTGGTLYSLFYSQVPGPRSQVPGPRSQVPVPVAWQLTISMGLYHHSAKAVRINYLFRWMGPWQILQIQYCSRPWQQPYSCQNLGWRCSSGRLSWHHWQWGGKSEGWQSWRVCRQSRGCYLVCTELQVRFLIFYFPCVKRKI